LQPDDLPVRYGEAGGFLSAVLKGEKAEKSHARHILAGGENA
jgi:hypothetical protein